MVPPIAILQEGRDAEPRRLSVFGRTVVGGQVVAHHLPAGRSVDELWFRTEASDDLHASQLRTRSSAEGAGRDAGDAREGRARKHFWSGVEVMDAVVATVIRDGEKG